MAANLCIYACRDDQDELLKFKLSKLRICIKGDLSYFECGMVFGDGQAARVYREWPKKRKYPASCGSLGENDARGKRRMAIPLLSC